MVKMNNYITLLIKLMLWTTIAKTRSFRNNSADQILFWLV